MSDQSLPSGGGSYVRQTDGTLKLDEPPTAHEAATEELIEEAVEKPVQARAPRNPVKEA